MANLTAAKADTAGRQGLLELLPFKGVFNQDFWRGGALVQRLSGANAGYVDRDVDGSEHGVFAGVTARTVKPRDADNVFLTQVLLDGDISLRIPVRRNGSQLFTTSGMTDPVQIGRLVFLTDDQTVSVIPPSQDFPLCAGRIIKIISATVVEVEIAAGIAWRPAWQDFACPSSDTVAASTDEELITDYAFDRRVFVREVAFTTVIAAAGGNITTRIDKAAVEAGGAGTQTLSGVQGVVAIHAINIVWEPTDTISVILEGAAGVSAGQFNAVIRYLPLD